MGKGLAFAMVAVVAATACTAGDDDVDAEVAGLTADTLELGVLGIDEEMISSLGIEADFVSPDPLMAAWVDAQNERGGVAGRQIEVVMEPFNPVGSTGAQAEAACLALTEDNPVFAVIGSMTGDFPLCFTEEHATPYLGMWGLSPERERRSEAPFVALEMADDRQRLAGVEALQGEGLLDGKVALYSTAADRPMIDEAVLPVLEDAGINIVADETLDDFGTDVTATDQAADVIAERIKVSGADTVLALSSYAALVPAFQRSGWLPDAIASTTQHGLSADFNEAIGAQPESLERVTIAGQYSPSKAELIDDAELQTCLDEYAATDPERPIDTAEVSRELLSGVAQLCGAFRLFVQATEAAADASEALTADSWGTGAESLGKLELPGIPLGSLSEDKHSVNDGVALYTYDSQANTMVAAGPPSEAGA